MNTNLKIIIYPHLAYKETDGGINVQYYLAQCLKEKNVNVKMFNNHGTIPNELFNDYCDYSFYDENTVVIYCEGVYGNPLNAKKVIRWMLSELGQNVPYDWVESWGKNELVYFYGSEIRFQNYPHLIGNVFKTMNVIYQKPNIKNNNPNERNGICHTFRKSFIHKEINFIHPRDSIEIPSFHYPINDMVDVFNKFKILFCYDPFSYVQTIAILCGCITVVYPLKNYSKKDWLQKTCIWDYLQENDLGTNLYGLAYGIEEMDFALSTIHLVEEQQRNICDFLKNRSIDLLLSDIAQFDENTNTIQNVYYDSLHLVNFYINDIKQCISVSNIDFTDTFIRLIIENPSQIVINEENFKGMSFKIIIHLNNGEIYEFNKNSILVINN